MTSDGREPKSKGEAATATAIEQTSTAAWCVVRGMLPTQICHISGDGSGWGYYIITFDSAESQQGAQMETLGRLSPTAIRSGSRFHLAGAGCPQNVPTEDA